VLARVLSCAQKMETAGFCKATEITHHSIRCQNTR